MTILPGELDILAYWIVERNNIRIRKERGDRPPWTKDLLLSEYRWCNARRMDDRVSAWLLRWHNDHCPDKDDIPSGIVAMVAGRLINWPETLNKMLYPNPYDELTWTKMLNRRKASGEKVFTGAYVINGALGGPKIEQVTQKILGHLWKNRKSSPKAPRTMQAVWEYLNGQPGIGSFMAGQAVADMRHVYDHLSWRDKLTWAPAGPGSIRGVNRLLGLPLEKRIPSDEWLDVVRRTYALLGARMPRQMARLELMDLQNCLCEFDKYRRLTLGQGTVRAKYRSHAP